MRFAWSSQLGHHPDGRPPAWGLRAGRGWWRWWTWTLRSRTTACAWEAEPGLRSNAPVRSEHVGGPNEQLRRSPGLNRPPKERLGCNTRNERRAAKVRKRERERRGSRGRWKVKRKRDQNQTKGREKNNRNHGRERRKREKLQSHDTRRQESCQRHQALRRQRQRRGTR
jgi:hypothetical protein